LQKLKIPKNRIEIARTMIAKSIYNMQTSRNLIDRLHSDRVLLAIYNQRYKINIPTEAYI